MNDGISAVALAMMCHYNQNKAVVGNTYQCYLKVKFLLYIKYFFYINVCVENSY